jgi:glycosyltransferase involved in cell wall biosynthesis
VEGENPGDALSAMRILHIGKFYPPVPGGMERFLGDLVEAQRAAGDEAAALVHSDGRADTRCDPPWLMRCPVWMQLAFAPISPAFVVWLHRAIKRYQPDVLHIHMPNVSAFWALLLPSALKRPWVIHWHADVEPSKFKLSLRLAYPYYRIFERALLERSECIVVTSPDYLEASKPLAPWRLKCHVVPLGVDQRRLPEIAHGETSGLWKGEGLRVLAIGRLSYYKGFETLIRAVLNDPDKELVIVGTGEERSKLQAILDRAGNPSHVRLAGEADDATCHRLLASCDVFCVPSRERTEAFGLVLLEAMRYGKPLLVSDLKGSGVTWVARKGQNAVLVPPEDVAAWSAALDSLSRHPDERQMLGHLGLQRYLREFDISGVARRIRELYARLMKERMEEEALKAAIFDPFATATYASAEGAAAAYGNSSRLLVVIPALNEADCIGSVIARARAHEDVDVLVIDDGSTDDTAAVALVEGATVLHAPLWQGAWGAIQTGIRYGVRHGYSGVVTMDADGQHEPIYLAKLIEAGRSADVVIAACASRGSRARHLAWAYFKLLTGFTLDDLTSGFRYYNARACRLLAREEATLLDYQDIGVLLLLRHAKLKISEIPVAMNPRKNGASRVFSSWWTVGRYMAETSLLCLARWNRHPRPPPAPGMSE